MTMTSRDMPGPAKRLLIAAAVIVLLSGGLFGWRAARTAPGPAEAPPPIPVVAIRVDPVAAPLALEAVGSLRAVREVMLAPEVAGRVVGIRFEAGGHARAGDLLVQLYDAPERADRAASEAMAKFAEAQLARSQTLASSGAEPRQLLDQRRAERDRAVAEVRQLDARIAQKQIRAPFPGQIGLRRVNPGQYLNPGDPIATLTAVDTLHVEFAVPQQELSRLKVGGLVRLASDAWPGRTFTARVNAVEPRIGEDTRNIMVQATVPNPTGELKPGMFVTAALELPPQPDALVVPTTAIMTSASGDAVTVVRDRDPQGVGKAEIVPVATGRRFGERVVVTRGLKAGDVVVTEGQLRIQPGALVRVTAPRSASAATVAKGAR